jgi:uncharacterized DUF497 family protein
MQFEFDPTENESSARKHGIRFEQAQFLWEDPDRLQVPARTQGGSRYMLIGKIDGKHWPEIFTLRGENVRIVSVRRSRTYAVNAYEI